ncbi:MAG: PKD domain-containing protein, partial [Bacteroidetes bacterium]|nr:PKD domain-containing protein [Bacteroidota bacterium]
MKNKNTRDIKARKLVLTMLSSIFFVFLYLGTFAQVNVTSTVPSFLYLCGNSDSFTVTVYNTSTTATLSSVKLKVIMPDGMFYDTGSVSGTNVSQYNIDTLNKPIFSLPNISPSTSLKIRFYASAGCNLTSSSLLTNTNRVDYNTSNYFTASSANYTVKKPSISISNITNQSATLNKCFDTLSRAITITNGGTGYLESFTFVITSEDNVIVYNINKGSVVTTGNTTTVTLSKSDFLGIGDNDSIFEYNESLVLTEIVVAGGIDSLDESYAVSWGCNNQVCQTNTNSASISINLSNVPNLVFTAYPYINRCYGASNASPQQIRIINTGSANAINIDLTVLQTINQNYAYYNNFYTHIDPNSFNLLLKGNSTTLTPISTTGTSSRSCFNTSIPKGKVVVRIPEIKAGDTALLQWDVYSCCADGSHLNGFGWSYSAEYKTPCHWNQVFTKPQSLGMSRQLQRVRFNEPLAPGNSISQGVSTKIGFEILDIYVWPGQSSQIFKYTVNSPNCLVIDTSSFTYTNYNDNLQWFPYQKVISGNDIVLYFSPSNRPSGFSFTDSKLRFNVVGDCFGCSNLGGYKDVTLSVSYVPTTVCSCEQKLGSQVNKIPLVCNTKCTTSALNRTKYSIVRNSYGLPDNDNNGFPDGSGVLDMSKIATERAMYGDTLRITMEGNVFGTNNWMNGYAINTFSENRLSNVGTQLTIYDASASSYYQCSNISYTKSGSTFKYDFGIASLNSNGCSIPSTYKYASGDSIFLVLDYKIISNIGGNSRFITVNSDYYLSYVQNPTQDSAKHFCGLDLLIGQFNIVGYYYTIYGTSVYYPKACEQFTASKGFYLSVGPCCNNYAGGNMFPFEYRPWAKLSKSIAVIPSGYSLVSAYLSYYRTTGTRSTSVQYVYDLTPDYQNGDTLMFDIEQYFNSGQLHKSDDGFHGYIYLTLIPNKCGFETPAAKEISWQYEFVPTSGFMPPIWTSNFSNNTVNSSAPNLKIQGLSTHQSIDTSANWQFSISNLSATSSAENSWVKVNSASGNIYPLYILNTLTSAVIYETNGYFNLGSLNTSSNKTFKLFAYHNTCINDTLKLTSGWTCDTNYLYNTPLCSSDSTFLFLEPLLANLELQVFTPADTAYLCDTIHYSLEVSNSLRGKAYQTKVQLQILQGLDIIPSSSLFKYPSASSFRLISDPVYKGNGIYEWDMESIDSTINNYGLSGTEDTSLNSLSIKFSLISNCNYISGSKFTIRTLAKNACGSQASASVATSTPTRIYGASEPYIATINVVTDTVRICSGIETIKVQFTNLGPDSTGDVDHLLLQLPLGINYNAGSTNKIYKADSLKEPSIQTISGYTELDWTIPPGLQSNALMEFEFSIHQDDVLTCSKYPLSFQSVVLDSLLCLASNDTCEFRSSTGIRTDSLTVYKPDLNIITFQANANIIYPDSELVNLTLTIQNGGAKIPTGDTTWVSFYHDSDRDNLISAGDSLFGRLYYADSIRNNQTISLNGIFTLDTAHVCPIIAVIHQDTGVFSNCICNQKTYLLDKVEINYDVNDTFICSGDSLFLHYDSLSSYTYQWNPTADIINPNSANPIFLFKNTTASPINKTFTITTYRTFGSCPFTDTLNILVYPQPTVNFQINDSTQCLNTNNFIFWNNANLPASNLNYFWDFGDGTNSSLDSSSTHVYSDTATYQVKMVVSTNQGCIDSNTKNAHVFINPVADFIVNDSSQCFNGNVFSFTNNSSVAIGNMTYYWDFGDGSNSTQTSPVHSYSNTGNYQVKLIVSSDNSCQDSIIKNVYVNHMPVANFSINDSSQCINANYSFTNLSSLSFGSLNYVWDFGDGNFSTTTNPVHFYNSIDTFSVKLIAISDAGCRDSIAKNVYTQPIPTAAFVINDSAQCLNNNSYTFTDSSSISIGTISSYKWFFGDGDSSILQNTSHAYSSDDTFNVYLIIQSSIGCTDTSMRQIIVYPEPIADFGINDSQQCFNTNQFVFSNSSSINSGTQTYHWTFGDGNSSSAVNPVYSYASYDTFTVKLVSTSNVGCSSDSNNKSVYIFPNPISNLSVNDSQQCVFGNQFIFTNSSSIIYGSLSYAWNFGDGNTSTANNPSHTYASDDTFTVWLLANSNLNCSDSALVTTYVFPKPLPAFSINDSQQCFNGNQFVFTNNSTINTGSQTYYWDFGDGSFSSLASPTHSYSTDDTFTVKLVNSSDLGCSDSLVKTVYVFPNPIADFSINDSQQCFNGNNFVFSNVTNINSGSMNYVWSFGDGNNSTVNSPSQSYASDDTFTVRLLVNSNLNCSDSAFKTTYVFPSPVPAFSINDSQQCFNGN